MDGSIRVAEIPASRGIAWLGESFQLFRRKPMAWIGLCAGWIVITVGLLMVPILGGVVANFLQPVFFASFAITAYRQAAGEDVVMGDLFLAFRRNPWPLIKLGAILLFAEITIFILMALLGMPMLAAGEKGFVMREYLESLQGKEWIFAIGFVLTVLVKGALWFAPPLIAFHSMSAGHAMRWSVYAALANIGAMLLYGVALFVLFFVGLVPWGLGLLVVIPMMVISTFIGYRDVFEAEPRTAA